MAQVIQIKRRIPGSGGPGTLAAGELATAISAGGVAELYIGDGGAVRDLVGAMRQVEVTGNQSIAGNKTFTGAIILSGPTLLQIAGGDDGDVLTTDGNGDLSWGAVSASTVGTTPPSPAEVGDIFYNTTTNVLMVYDGTDWQPVPANPTGAGIFGRTSAGAWTAALPLAGGSIGTTGLTIGPTSALNIAPGQLHISGGTDGFVLSTNGSGVNSWIEMPRGSFTTEPAPPEDGDLWFDDPDLKVWDGTQWITVNLIDPTAAGVWGRTSAGVWQLALPLAGGTMAGAITFAAGQTIAGYLPLTLAANTAIALGAHDLTFTGTGEVILNSHPLPASDDLTAATKKYVDDAAAAGFTGVTVSAPITGSGLNAGTALGLTMASTAQVDGGSDAVHPISSATLRSQIIGGANGVASLATTNKLVVPAINELNTQIGAVSGAIRLVGTYDADEDEVSAPAGSPAADGQALPQASAANEGWYVIVTEPATGSGHAPHVPLAAGDWLVSTGDDWVHVPLNITTFAASNVTVSAVDSQGWANVQAAIQGLFNRSTTAGNTAVSADQDSILGDGTSVAPGTGVGPLRVGTIDGGTF